MQLNRARLILCLVIVSVILTYVPLDGLINWQLVFAKNKTGIDYSDYSSDFTTRFYCCLVGTIWTFFTAIGIITIFLPYEKTFIWGGIYWIVVTIITAVYIILIITWSSFLVHSYKDLTTSERIGVESDKQCCFYTDEVEREDRNGKNITDYTIYANCPVIDKSNPDINWSNCEGEGDDMVCSAYDVGVESNVYICDSDSDYFVFSMFALLMITYCFSTLMFGVMYFICYRLTRTKKCARGYEDLDSTVKQTF